MPLSLLIHLTDATSLLAVFHRRRRAEVINKCDYLCMRFALGNHRHADSVCLFLTLCSLNFQRELLVLERRWLDRAFTDACAAPNTSLCVLHVISQARIRRSASTAQCSCTRAPPTAGMAARRTSPARCFANKLSYSTIPTKNCLRNRTLASNFGRALINL